MDGLKVTVDIEAVAVLLTGSRELYRFLTDVEDAGDEITTFEVFFGYTCPSGVALLVLLGLAVDVSVSPVGTWSIPVSSSLEYSVLYEDRSS